MVRAASSPPGPEEEQICPLCINELDETEKAWLPCSCGYQLCLFCYDRLKTEFSNQCPNCRVEYDSDFQAGLRRRQERVAQLQREAAQREAAPRPAVLVAERPAAKHAVPLPPPPRAARSPRSPRRELHIGQEQLWPSLGAATQPAAPQHPQQLQQLQPAARQQPPSPLAGGRRRQQGSPPAAPQPPAPPPRLAPILQAPLEAETSSSSSSADTTATTPQSPVSSVVTFRAAPAAVAPLLCGAGRPLELALAAQPEHAAAAAVQGRCAVVLPRGGGLGADPDPEGASLAASLQEAVRSGSLSVKQAAASLASYLRQRQHAAGAAALGCAAGAAGLAGLQQPISASYAADAVRFGLPAAGEHSLLPCGSGISSTTSASLSHWAPGSQPLPVLQPLPTLLDGSAAPSTSWQQQQQQVGSPVRENDKLPLFLRRGSLRQAGAGSGGGTGSPSGSAGSGASSSAGSGSFPGFPSRPSSPTQELKRMIVPPPGFGPMGSNGIAALPRFR